LIHNIDRKGDVKTIDRELVQFSNQFLISLKIQKWLLLT